MKKILLVLFFIFGLGLLFSHNSYADVSDYTYNWSWSNHPSYILCGGDSGRSCSDYTYVIFNPSGTCSDNLPSFYVYGLGSSSVNNMVSPCSQVIAPIGGSILRLTGGQYLESRYSGDISITLTNSISSCNCPEPEPQEPCDDPEENSRFIQVVIDAFWKYHIAFAGCAAALIAIFVLYRIIKGLLR